MLFFQVISGGFGVLAVLTRNQFRVDLRIKPFSPEKIYFCTQNMTNICLVAFAKHLKFQKKVGFFGRIWGVSCFDPKSISGGLEDKAIFTRKVLFIQVYKGGIFLVGNMELLVYTNEDSDEAKNTTNEVLPELGFPNSFSSSK